MTKNSILIESITAEELTYLIRTEIKKNLTKINVTANSDAPQKIDPADDDYFTAGEICDRFKITRYTLNNWVKDGTLTPKRLQGTKKLLFTRSQINKKLKSATEL